MGQILHGSATTTEAVRRAIQNSEESLRALSARYGINQKTVAKWRKRTSVADLPTGPKDATPTVLTPDEEAVIVAFRRRGARLPAYRDQPSRAGTYCDRSKSLSTPQPNQGNRLNRRWIPLAHDL